MSINPNFQGKGYAKLVLFSINEFIKSQQWQFKKIILGVNHKNTPAQKLYKSSNFKKIERTYLGKQGIQFIYELTLE